MYELFINFLLKNIDFFFEMMYNTSRSSDPEGTPKTVAVDSFLTGWSEK